MRRLCVVILICLSVNFKGTAQESGSDVYDWNWAIDGPWTAAGLGGSAYGFVLIQNKKEISESYLETLNPDDINDIDSWAAGNFSENADKASYLPFYASFAMPFALLLDDEINDESLTIIGLYIESLSTTAAMYTISAGLVNRSRPYVYSENAPMEKRTSSSGQRSFFSGHVAATATATFFAAKVFADYHPNSNARFFVWTGAAVIPAAVGYYRLEAGQHFLTDVLLGYGLGALTGYAVPALHKKDRKVRLYPTSEVDIYGNNVQALGISYRF
ncbi:phosphatase PAP2 family protein [Neptunitalea lumnitzerae]|uniref:Phosphatidic acid phosphatase type 2/haloperoxidase domain-containing protein n=1 Tax=Neptunitalea lumnitzerae TaxID=2965509 RepID=A0ABQ5MM07_9FLAO|nr:phosphatase PAP2 family protein [Neptunitalea sp. Y10]GLB50440.1 hypothetical protein Y10_28080 [Neptunitalea sp. Y10]